jgi:hypothetical protein
VIAAIVAVFLTAAGVSLFSTSRSVSQFAVGPRSATGSPIERSLPEPPNWKQFVALAASRRAEELNRLLDLADTMPELPAQIQPQAVEDAATDRPLATETSPAAPEALQE